jgi:hydroxymethylglutaryl-CoA lyase
MNNSNMTKIHNDQRFVLLEEVGPRDGLQNEPKVLSPEARARLIEQLQDSGLRRIQIGSFVNPKLVPQMAGTDEVWRLLKKGEGVRYSVLVLSEKGLRSAIAERIPHVAIYVSASDTHSRKNVGMPLMDALEKALKLVNMAAEHRIEITAGIMCAFGCFYEGKILTEKIVDLVGRFPLESIQELGLADTTGMGDPEGVSRLIAALKPLIPPDRIAMHLHDTHAGGYDNLQAGLDAGVRKFDVSIGGLGGCPFIPGAAGNISTERTVELLDSLGFYTGIDSEAVGRIGRELKEVL